MFRRFARLLSLVGTAIGLFSSVSGCDGKPDEGVSYDGSKITAARVDEPTTTTLSYTPLWAPVKISVNTNGDVSVSVANEMRTSIGVFEISRETPIAKIGLDHPNALLVGVGDKAHVFDFDPNTLHRPLIDMPGSYQLTNMTLPAHLDDPLLIQIEPRPKSALSELLSRSASKTANLLELGTLPTLPIVPKLPGIDPKRKKEIADFILASDMAQAQAVLAGNPLQASAFFAEDAYRLISEQIEQNSKNGEIADIKLDQDKTLINNITIASDGSTIDVDMEETWSRTTYEYSTGKLIATYPPVTFPQTLTISQTPKGWFVVKMVFKSKEH